MKYTEKDFTQWHDGKTKPINVGLYQVRNEYTKKGWAVWSGKYWAFTMLTNEGDLRTYRAGWGESALQNNSWRGLRVKPKE